MTFHLGLATTLSPAATGPAEFVAGVLPEMARAARISCFVQHPDEVDPALRERFVVRPLGERDDPSVDLLVYHIANNLTQAPVYDAAMDGPPGLLEIHDGSLHHMLATRTIGSDDTQGYQDLLHKAHGVAGDGLARLRLHGHPAGIELFMFDLLRDLLERHLGVVVHNRYAADLIALRSPALPVWVVPLSAPVPAPVAARGTLGLPEGELLIAHFGFVTPPKRPYLLLEAFSRLQAAGVDCHLLFAGRDDTCGQLAAEIDRLGLTGHVTVTGYLAREEMDALISAVDIVVSLRFPHVGETSATLGAALGAGRPVIVQETGSWAELPERAVLRIPAIGDEVTALTEALLRLATHPEERASLGQAAGAYAAEWLGAERYALGIVDAARALSHSSRVPPSQQLEQRRTAVAAFMAEGSQRLTTATLLDGNRGRDKEATRPAGYPGIDLGLVPPARPGARLLDVTADPGASRPYLRLLECVWGYQTQGCELLGDQPGAGAAHRPAPHGHFDRADLSTGLPYDCATYDVVTCWDALPPDPVLSARLLAEINRALRPGGLLILSTRAPIARGMASLLDDAGLSADQIAGIPPAPCTAIARKVTVPVST